MINLNISQMLGWFDPIANWFQSILACVFAYILVELYAVFAGIAFLVDVFQQIFRQLAGLGISSTTSASSTTATSSGDIASDFLRNGTVTKVFLNLALVGVVLLLVCVIIAMIKTEYNQDGKNTKSHIIGQAVKAAFTFMLVPALCLGGIFLANGLLKTLDKAVALGQSTSIGGQVFIAAAYDANRSRVTLDANGNKNYSDENFYNEIASSTENNYNLGYFGENFNGASSDTTEIADQIDYAMVNGLASDSFESGFHYVKSFDNPGTYFFGDMTYLTPGSFNYLNPIAVAYYYDIMDVNVFILFGGIIVIFLLMCNIVLGLIKRIYMLTALFIISPPIIAMMPLDNGKAFGSWKSSFVGYVLGAYGSVIGMNLAFIFMALSNTVVFNVSLFGGNYVFNSLIVSKIMSVLFLLVALTIVKQLPQVLSGFIGAKDATSEGQSMSSDVMSYAAKGAKATIGVGAVAAAAGGKFVGKAANFTKSRTSKARATKYLNDQKNGEELLENPEKFEKLKQKANGTYVSKFASSKVGKGVNKFGSGLGKAALGIGKGSAGIVKNASGFVASHSGFAQDAAKIVMPLGSYKGTKGVKDGIKDAGGVKGIGTTAVQNATIVSNSVNVANSKILDKKSAIAKIKGEKNSDADIKKYDSIIKDENSSKDEKSAAKASKAVIVNGYDDKINALQDEKHSAVEAKRDINRNGVAPKTSEGTEIVKAEHNKGIMRGIFNNIGSKADGENDEKYNELVDAVRRAFAQSGFSSDAFARIFSDLKINGDVKLKDNTVHFESNEISKFISKIDEQTNAITTAAKKSEKKSDSDLLLDAIKEMSSKIDKLGGDSSNKK